MRVHTGPQAAAACESIDARTFTVGNHVAFGRGEYDPDSPEGQHVLAHELAHVRQQTGGALSMLPQAGLELEIDPDPELEREAEETAQQVLSGDQTGSPWTVGVDVHVQRIRKFSGDEIENPVWKEIDLGKTETLPGDDHIPQPDIGKNEYLALAKEERDDLLDRLREKYGEGEKNLPLDDNGDIITTSDNYVPLDSSKPLTADDVLKIHEKWKLKESGQAAGLLWEKIQREVLDIEATPKPPWINGEMWEDEPDRAPNLELTEEAEALIIELTMASREFIRENHEDLDVPTREGEDGEIYVTLERGENYHSPQLAKEMLNDPDANSYEVEDLRSVERVIKEFTWILESALVG